MMADVPAKVDLATPARPARRHRGLAGAAAVGLVGTLFAPLPAAAAPAPCEQAERYAAQSGAEAIRIDKLDLRPAGRRDDPVGGIGVGDAKSALVAQSTVNTAAIGRVLDSGPAGRKALTGALIQQAPPTNKKPNRRATEATEAGPFRLGAGEVITHARWEPGMACGATVGEATRAETRLSRGGILADGDSALVGVPAKLSSLSTTALERHGSAARTVAAATVTGSTVELLNGTVKIKIVRAPSLRASMSTAGGGEIRYLPAVIEVSSPGHETARLDTAGDEVELALDAPGSRTAGGRGPRSTDQGGAGRNSADQSGAGQSGTGQSGTGQSGAGQNSADGGVARLGGTRQKDLARGGTGQGNAGQRNAGQGNTGQGNAGQNGAGQNGAGQNGAGLDVADRDGAGQAEVGKAGASAAEGDTTGARRDRAGQAGARRGGAGQGDSGKKGTDGDGAGLLGGLPKLDAIGSAPPLPLPSVPGLPPVTQPDTETAPVAGPGTTVRISLGDVRQAASEHAIAAKATAVTIAIAQGGQRYGRSSGVVLDLGMGLLEVAAVAPEPGGGGASSVAGSGGALAGGLPITGPRVDVIALTGVALLIAGAAALLFGLRGRFRP